MKTDDIGQPSSKQTKKNEKTLIVVRGPLKSKKDPQFHGTGGPRTPTFQNKWELCQFLNM